MPVLLQTIFKITPLPLTGLFTLQSLVLPKRKTPFHQPVARVSSLLSFHPHKVEVERVTTRRRKAVVANLRH